MARVEVEDVVAVDSLVEMSVNLLVVETSNDMSTGVRAFSAGLV